MGWIIAHRQRSWSDHFPWENTGSAVPKWVLDRCHRWIFFCSAVDGAKYAALLGTSLVTTVYPWIHSHLKLSGQIISRESVGPKHWHRHGHRMPSASPERWSRATSLRGPGGAAKVTKSQLRILPSDIAVAAWLAVAATEWYGPVPCWIMHDLLYIAMLLCISTRTPTYSKPYVQPVMTLVGQNSWAVVICTLASSCQVILIDWATGRLEGLWRINHRIIARYQAVLVM